MPKAMRIHRTGGPEMFEAEDVPTGSPGPGQARIRHGAIGVNFLDTYLRSGQYPLRQPLPCILGGEGAGTVLELGPGAGDHLKLGDRVVYSGQQGSYCEERLVRADRVVRIPNGMSETDAAAIFNKGMTAEYLIRRAYPVRAGDTILVHAAAGAVGTVLCQWGKFLGATVLGTVSTEAKADVARQNGADHIIFYTREDFAARARALTKGAGVAAVFDSVGKETFLRSMDALRPRGYLVCFGEASGPAPAFDPRLLMDKGSLFVTRASLLHYAATVEELRAAAATLFDTIAQGGIKICLNQTYRLADVAQAHRDLEARRTVGSSVLLP
jgi:NADPH2:quinone reductase